MTNFGSMAELADKMGGQLLHFEADWGWQNAMTAKASIPGIVQGLDRSYAERGTEAALTRRKWAFAGAQAYEIDRVFMDHGIGVLEAIADATMGRVK